VRTAVVPAGRGLPGSSTRAAIVASGPVPVGSAAVGSAAAIRGRGTPGA
jgi:hypothetical protein